MLVVTVWYLTSHLKEESLNDLHQRLVKAIIGIEELGLKTKEEMTCLFPTDMMQYRDGTEIVVQVSGVLGTLEVQQRLTSALSNAVEGWWHPAGLKKPNHIEVLIHPLGPCPGFWYYTPEVRVARNHILHIECVTGIVQVLLALKDNKSGDPITVDDLSRIGYEGKSDLAGMYIFEFVKDRIVNRKSGIIGTIITDDYAWVWRMMNSYLKRFGHEPIKPVPITV